MGLLKELKRTMTDSRQAYDWQSNSPRVYDPARNAFVVHKPAHRYEDADRRLDSMKHHENREQFAKARAHLLRAKSKYNDAVKELQKAKAAAAQNPRCWYGVEHAKQAVNDRAAALAEAEFLRDEAARQDGVKGPGVLRARARATTQAEADDYSAYFSTSGASASRFRNRHSEPGFDDVPGGYDETESRPLDSEESGFIPCYYAGSRPPPTRPSSMMSGFPSSSSSRRAR